MAGKKRKTQARRKTTRAKTSGSTRSSSGIWSVLMAGVVIGLFIAFGVYVYTSGKYQTLGKGLGKLYSNISTPEPNANREIKQEVTQLTPHFDYYKILLKNERPIPRFDEPTRARKPEKKTEKSTAETKKPASVYMLQVGAFREHKDAEELKARLAFSGLVANIQRVKLPEKGVFHRVRLGPFKTIGAMNRADTKLAKQGIKAARMQVVQ